MVLNTATFLEPHSKDVFSTLKNEVKLQLVEKCDKSPKSLPVETTLQKKDLKATVVKYGIQGERKKQNYLLTVPTSVHAESKIRNELTVYETMPELSAEQDCLTWWKTNENTFLHLAHLAKKYPCTVLCIAASSCASECVQYITGLICNPRRARLTEEHIGMRVFV